jgi:hypothetical protein
VCTLLEKNLSTGTRFKQVIWKGFLRLDIQPVQLISPTSITDKKIHQPSNDIRIILVNLEILDKYPALVLHYSEGVLLLLRFCVIIIYCALN